METRSVTPQIGDFARVLALYEEAFPPEERIPIEQLVELSAERGVDFEAYYDEGELCGFTYNIVTPDYLYVLFFAVLADKRSGGIGSRILGFLKERFSTRTIVLEIEPLDSTAKNYAQRVKRLAFYERNGFTRTGYDLYEEEMRYTVLSVSGDFDAIEFAAQVESILHGQFPMELKLALD